MQNFTVSRAPAVRLPLAWCSLLLRAGGPTAVPPFPSGISFRFNKTWDAQELC